MKLKSNFLQSPFFSMLLPFLLVVGFGFAAWSSIKPKQPKVVFEEHSSSTANTKSVSDDRSEYPKDLIPEPKDNFLRPDAVGKIEEKKVFVLKRDSMPIEWTENYKIVLQINFPDNTRAAFFVIVRDDETKHLFSALVDTRDNRWKDTIWIGYPMDDNLDHSDLPVPCEMDVVRSIQQRFRKFEPYWIHPSNRNKLLARDAWLSAMTIALIMKDEVKLR